MWKTFLQFNYCLQHIKLHLSCSGRHGSWSSVILSTSGCTLVLKAMAKVIQSCLLYTVPDIHASLWCFCFRTSCSELFLLWHVACIFHSNGEFFEKGIWKIYLIFSKYSVRQKYLAFCELKIRCLIKCCFVHCCSFGSRVMHKLIPVGYIDSFLSLDELASQLSHQDRISEEFL